MRKDNHYYRGGLDLAKGADPRNINQSDWLEGEQVRFETEPMDVHNNRKIHPIVPADRTVRTNKTYGRIVGENLSKQILRPIAIQKKSGEYEEKFLYFEFSKDIIMTILNQQGCKGLRFYPCKPIEVVDGQKKIIEDGVSLLIEPFSEIDIDILHKDLEINEQNEEDPYKSSLSRSSSLSSTSSVKRAEVGGIGGGADGGF